MRLFIAIVLSLVSMGCAAHSDRDTFAARVKLMDKDERGNPIPPCETPIARECIVR